MATKKSDVYVMPAEQSVKLIADGDLLTICRAWENYKGNVEIIEAAIGALLIGRLVGYDGLRMIHSWKTLRNYEGLLGVKFKEILREATPDTERINGIRYAKKFGELWRALAAGVGSQPGARDLAR